MYAYASIAATQPLFDTIRPTAREVGTLNEEEKATIKYLRQKNKKSYAELKRKELSEEAYAAMGSKYSKISKSPIPQFNLFDD